MILYVQAQVPKDTNKLQHQSFNVSLKIKTFTITIPLVPELKHAYLPGELVPEIQISDFH